MTPKKNLHIIKCPYSLKIEEEFLILFVPCIVNIITHTHIHQKMHTIYIL